MPTTESHIGQFFIQVDGSDLPVAVMDRLDAGLVEDDLAQPAMFMLRFHDPDLKLIDGDQFGIGREIKIGAANAQGQRKRIVTGEITALELELEQHDPALVVRGYDRGHRLHRGRKTRTFLNQTDADIARRIAQEAGLKPDIEATGEQLPYVIQDNQTDMAFLHARATRIGYSVNVVDRTLKFGRVTTTPPSAPALDWGNSLRSFRVRLTAVAQPNEVQVRSWDAKAKRPVVGKATEAAQLSRLGDSRTAGAVAQQSFGSAAAVTISDQPVRTEQEANKLAQAVLDELAGDYLIAEGICRGEPALIAGTLVDVKGVGQRLSGSYFVTASRHEYTPDGGYTTTFTVNGRRPNGLLGTLDGTHAPHTTDGVVIGIVTNVNDPDKLGRVKVKFPWLTDTYDSDWARLATPGGGKERGLMVMPEVDDEVLVAFEHGDISRPYVIGGLWNGKDAPPAAAVQKGKIQTRTIKTRAGHLIELQDDDETGTGFVQIKTKGGRLIKLNDNNKQILIQSQKHSVTLDDQGLGVVTVKSEGDLEFTANRNLEFTANGGKLSITTAGVELSANAKLDVKTSGILTIQGSLVKIN